MTKKRKKKKRTKRKKRKRWEIALDEIKEERGADLRKYAKKELLEWIGCFWKEMQEEIDELTGMLEVD